MKKILLIMPVALLLTGCFQSQIVSPGRKNLVLATQRDACTEVDSRKVYALFGLGAAAFNDATSIPSLQKVENNEKVRFTTKISFVDYLIQFVTLGIVGSHTIKTEVCQ